MHRGRPARASTSELRAREPSPGNAYDAGDAPHVPARCTRRSELLEGSALAREAFGDEVVDHYLHAARIEQRTFDAAVTDWELFRGFERL